jgi:hypothetical protein
MPGTAATSPALARLLHHDVILRMPPEPGEFRGREAVPPSSPPCEADGRLDQLPLLVTAANGHPALATYDTTSEGT